MRDANRLLPCRGVRAGARGRGEAGHALGRRRTPTLGYYGPSARSSQPAGPPHFGFTRFAESKSPYPGERGPDAVTTPDGAPKGATSPTRRCAENGLLRRSARRLPRFFGEGTHSNLGRIRAARTMELGQMRHAPNYPRHPEVRGGKAAEPRRATAAHPSRRGCAAHLRMTDESKERDRA